MRLILVRKDLLVVRKRKKHLRLNHLKQFITVAVITVVVKKVQLQHLMHFNKHLKDQLLKLSVTLKLVKLFLLPN